MTRRPWTYREILTVVTRFSARRMVLQYHQELYEPLAHRRPERARAARRS